VEWVYKFPPSSTHHYYYDYVSLSYLTTPAIPTAIAVAARDIKRTSSKYAKPGFARAQLPAGHGGILRHAMLCYAMLCHAMLVARRYHTVSDQTRPVKPYYSED
jgi:hypothetical protein